MLAKTKLSPSSSTFPKRRSQGNQEQIQLNIDEKEEQVGQGVSQDVVVSLLRNISRKKLLRTKKLHYNYDEKEEQVGRGVSQDVVVSILRKTF